MGGTVKCSGAAKIKPPFEMGVDNSTGIIEKYEDPAGDGNSVRVRGSLTTLTRLRNTKTPQGTETPICHGTRQGNRAIEKYEDPAGDGNQ